MLRAVLVSLRPRQWAKNLFLFAGLVFAGRLFTPSVWTALAAFVIFCALSGAIYLVNDVADREKDRLHPTKRLRPVAAGRLPWRTALGAALVLAAAGLAGAARLSAGTDACVIVAGCEMSVSTPPRLSASASRWTLFNNRLAAASDPSSKASIPPKPRI